MGPRATSRAPDNAAAAQRVRLLDAAGARATLDVDGHAITLTSLDRVYWPAEAGAEARDITKRDFVAYLAQVSASMLPHLRDRPLTLFRWPNGIAARRVLQKHWDIALPPFVERVHIFSETKGHDDEYILCNNLATLLWLGEMGTLEFHGWHSRIQRRSEASHGSAASGSIERLQASSIDFPDYVLFDLDPFIYSGREPAGAEPDVSAAAFAKAGQVALWLKAVLDAMSLRSWVKTSGKTGLHVIVPIDATLRFDAVRSMAEFIGQHLLKSHPDEITMEWSVPRRRGKVFLDYNMNVRGKSMTAPYSPRGLPGAPVSMPLSWRELEHAQTTDFRIATVPSLLQKHGDRWREALSTPQNLEAILSGAASARS